MYSLVCGFILLLKRVCEFALSPIAGQLHYSEISHVGRNNQRALRRMEYFIWRNAFHLLRPTQADTVNFNESDP